MNPNQYSCNTLRLFLAHTLNYQWLSFWQGDKDSYGYGSFFQIILSNDRNLYTDWDVYISLIEKNESGFDIRGYKSTEYNGRTALYSFDWKVYFK